MTLALALLILAMLGATALAWGGYRTLSGGHDRQRGWLMIAAAAVVVGNVLILTL